MNRTLDFTLLTDGPSDRVLLHPIGWLLSDLGWTVTGSEWADFSGLPEKPMGLRNRIRAAVALYPARVLMIHRDAEREPRETRVREVRAALEGLGLPEPPAVCVVPVRMTEAWLLVEEPAIRRAAGNPNGSVRLDMPLLRHLEDLPDPKDLLHRLLRDASELPARRMARFNVSFAVQRVGELVRDYSPLRRLSAFQAFEAEVTEMLSGLA